MEKGRIVKITRDQVPELFKEILEYEIDTSYNQHRRGATFYTKSIIEFMVDHKEYFPDLDNFKDFLGTWETNTYVTDDNYGSETDAITELIRVRKVKKIVETYVWEKE